MVIVLLLGYNKAISRNLAANAPRMSVRGDGIPRKSASHPIVDKVALD
jgi:hypothetical protein